MTIHDVETPLPYVVTTTVASVEDARRLAQNIIATRLAACVTARQVTSTYRWKGAVEQADEIELSMKTSPARLSELMSWLQRSHPYDNPEILAAQVAACAPAYARWVVEETAQD